MMPASGQSGSLPRWQDMHCLWAAQQQAEGAFEAAAAGFLAGDRPAAAIAAIARRGTADALQVPLDLPEEARRSLCPAADPASAASLACPRSLCYAINLVMPHTPRAMTPTG